MNEIGIGAAIFAAVILVLEIISKLGIWKAKDATIEQKDATIEQKDATIENLKEQRAALERFRSKEFVEDPEGRIRALEALLETTTVTIAMQEEQLTEEGLMVTQIEELQKRIAALKKQNEGLHEDIANLKRTVESKDVQDFTAAAASAVQSVGSITGQDYLGHSHGFSGEAYCPACKKAVWTHHGGCAACGGPVEYPSDRGHAHGMQPPPETP